MSSWSCQIVPLCLMFLTIAKQHEVLSSVNKEGLNAPHSHGGGNASGNGGDAGSRSGGEGGDVMLCPGDRLQGLLSFAWGLPPAPSNHISANEATRLLYLRNNSGFIHEEERIRQLVSGSALGPIALAPMGNASLLHYLAVANDTSLLRLLLSQLLLTQNGTDAAIALRDDRGETPLHWAARHNRPTAIDAFMQIGRLNPNVQSHIPIYVPSLYKYYSITEFLDFVEDVAYPMPIRVQHTPLHIAAENGHMEVMEALLRAGADIEAKDGARPFRSNVTSTPLAYATKIGSWKAFNFLLEHGANVSGNDALHRAAAHNNVAAMRMLLEKGAYKNARDEFKSTPLHWAAGCGRQDAMKLLLESGADANLRDFQGNTPLAWAAQFNNGKGIRMLVNAIASIERGILLKVTKSYRSDALQTLIELGANVNHRDYSSGKTPLMMAVENDNEKGVKMLMEASADSSIRDSWGDAPLHTAAYSGDVLVVRALVNGGADLRIRDDQGRTPLILGAMKNNSEVIRFLFNAGAPLDDGDQCNTTALHYAAAYHKRGALRTLLELGSHIDAQNCKGCTPLHYTVKNNVFCFSRDDCPNIEVEILLAAGANVHVQDKEGNTPLMYHAMYTYVNRNPAVIRTLARAGACIEDRNVHAKTALHLAAERESERVPFMEALLTLGANVNATDAKGKTALHIVCESGDENATALLLKAGADPNARDNEQRTPIYTAASRKTEGVLRLLLNATGADAIARESSNGTTALHVAVMNNTLEAVVLLLKAGADPDAKDLQEQTPIFLAAAEHELSKLRTLLNTSAVNATTRVNSCSGALSAAAATGNTEAIALLLKAGGDPNIRVAGRTALMAAAERGGRRDVEALVLGGARLEERDRLGRTALHWSVLRNSSAPAMTTLIALGASLNAADFQRATPLHLAVDASNIAAVEALLSAGADPNAADASERTTLTLALENQNNGTNTPGRGGSSLESHDSVMNETDNYFYANCSLYEYQSEDLSC